MNISDLGRILVIVPHQDDEILMCAGILHQAAGNGQEVLVVMVTNGDYGDTDGAIGRTRLGETLAGLGLLGVGSEQVEFLGYADTGMPKEESFLYQLYVEKDADRVYRSRCSAKTYGLEDKPEWHYQVHGTHAAYTRNAVKQDLQEVMAAFRPDTVFTTSEFDSHGDHSGLYLFIREILGGWREEGHRLPALYSGIVHSLAGDECWPDREKLTDYTCPAGFEATSSLRWEERIRFPVPETMLGGAKEENLKWRALSMHVTALKPDAVDFLYAFIKREEIFWKIVGYDTDQSQDEER